MRLANVAGRAAIVVGDHVVDAAQASSGRFGPDLRSIYDQWHQFRQFADGVADRSATAALDEVRLGPPSPEPRQVFGIGVNYRSHADEVGLPVSAVPATFTKFPTCLAGPDDDVVLSGETVDWEVELVVVIGVAARAVARDDAWSCVAGLTVGQDISDRTIQFAAGNQFSLGKSFPGFGPMGPVLVTADELDDPDDLAIGCSINGEVVQDARTSDLVADVPRLVAELSAIVPLAPGDVIFTGTPAGVGFTRQPPRWLRPGDVIESWIEGVGTMRNRCVEPSSTPSQARP